MTKVLYIKDFDDSFAAVTIENNIGIKEFAKMVEENGGILEFQDDILDIACDAKILEFKDVDPAFSVFIKNNFVDYDMGKSTNYFIL